MSVLTLNSKCDKILKIAKTPVVADIPTLKEEKKEETQTYDSVKPISIENDVKDDVTFDEKQIVEEMIRRLSSRLEKIEQRQSKLEDDKLKKESDQNFVNDLIKNKPRILIMTKKDLCDLNVTNKWIEYYKKQGYEVVLLDLANNPNMKVHTKFSHI